MVWLLYGAYGYTGKLIAEEAVRRGVRPILAGRNEKKLRPLSEKLTCDARKFNLSDRRAIVEQLEGCAAVLNCAGPFSQTARPVMEACLDAGVHYLDITGEIDVIEAAAALDGRAKEAGIVLMPAVGFDVVPTDCLAAMLAEKMPDAAHLRLALCAPPDISPGTAKTLAEMLPQGGRVRENGKIIRVPLGWKVRSIRFADRRRQAMTMPWGDVASAYYSTRIENIEVYGALPKRTIKLLRRGEWLVKMIGFAPLQWLLKRWIAVAQKGPSLQQRNDDLAQIWGEVSREDGASLQATMTTPNGYALTVETALAAVRILASSGRSGDLPHVCGFQTPSRALGSDFVLQFDNVTFQFQKDDEDR